jgi:CheY-like chemotaxis protein
LKKKILLVEDASMSVAVMKKEIEFLGYECIVAINGKEAIKKASEYLPDMIVMDIALPKMNGLEATSHIRKIPETKGIPILAATALTMPGDREKCLQAGCDDYLAKPFGHKELGSAIKSLLEKSPMNC